MKAERQIGREAARLGCDDAVSVAVDVNAEAQADTGMKTDSDGSTECGLRIRRAADIALV